MNFSKGIFSKILFRIDFRKESARITKVLKYWRNEIFAAILLILLTGSVSFGADRNPDLVLRVHKLPESGIILQKTDFSALKVFLKDLPSEQELAGYSLRYNGIGIPTQFVPTDSAFQGILIARLPKKLIADSGKKPIELELCFEKKKLGEKNILEKIRPVSEYKYQSGGNTLVFRSGLQGGFPSRIEFGQTGKVYESDTFFWEDRIFLKELGGFNLRLDKQARLDLVSDGPICSILRTGAKFVNFQGKTPKSSPEAVYYWICFKDSPYIYVQADYRQKTPMLWKETHFCEFHQNGSFTQWIGSSSEQTEKFSGADKMVRFNKSAALFDDFGNSLIMFGNSTCVYDGKNRTSSYLLLDPNFAWQQWETTENSNSGWIALTRLPEKKEEKRTVLQEIDQKKYTASGEIDLPALKRGGQNWRDLLISKLLIEGYKLTASQIESISSLKSGSVSDQGYLALESADLGLLFALTKTVSDDGSVLNGLDLLGVTDKNKNTVLSASKSFPIFAMTVRDCSFRKNFDKKNINDPTVTNKQISDGKNTSVNKKVLIGKSTGEKKRELQADPEIKFDSTAGWKQLETVTRKNGIQFIFKNPQAVKDLNLTAILSVHCDAAKRGVELEFEYKAETDRYSVLEFSYPSLKVRPFGSEMTAFYPTGPGILLDDPIETRIYRDNHYPTGFGAPMSWLQINDKTTGSGIYFAVHDPWATARFLKLDGKSGKDLVLECRYIAADKSKPGNSWKIPGRVHWEAVSGDWYDGALIYRDWVRREANWYPKLGPEGREDTPLWMRRLSLWAIGGHGDPMALVEPLRKFQKAFGVPTGFHWYCWHEIPFDNDYPHFLPAKKGFHQAVNELQKDETIFIMPYINGRLWDSKDRGMDDWQFTSIALKGVSKNEDGSPVLESYQSKEKDGNKVRLGVMCPTTEVWRAKMREVVLRLMNEEGVAAVYMDQIAASRSSLCMDPEHGHPLGGGSWWCPAYWEMLDRIRTDMKREVADYPLAPEEKAILKARPDLLKNRMLTTECNMEPQAAAFDGYLTWHWQFDRSVPAFSVVYGGAVQMFGRSYGGNSDAWRMKAAEELIFGEQIGWFNISVIKDSEKFDFIKQAVQLRAQNVEYFYKGEMARPAKFKDPIPRITEDWKWSGQNWPVSNDAVRTSVWRILDFAAKQKGETKVCSVLILFSNPTKQVYKSRIGLDLSELGIDSGRFRLHRVDSDGKRTDLSESYLNGTLEFPAKSSWALELIPITGEKKDR